MELKFEDIPHVLGELVRKIERIELLLTQSSTQANDNEELLTIGQVSELVHLQVPTLYAYVHKKEIPHCKKGKRLYFSRPEIIEWIKQGKNNSISETCQQAENFLNSKAK